MTNKEDFPNFNTIAKGVFWNLIEKYDKSFPEFCDALSNMIKCEHSQEELTHISKFMYYEILEDIDRKALQTHMNFYYSYIESLSFDEYRDDCETDEKPTKRNSSMGFLILGIGLVLGLFTTIR